MNPDIFETIKLDVVIDPGNSLTEAGVERLRDAIEGALYDNDFQHAIWTELQKRLPDEFEELVHVRESHA